MPHLIIIRHSNTRVSASVANKDWAITSEGLTRTVTLAQQLAPYQIETLYTSTFAKTKLTGQVLADALGIDVAGARHAFDENDRKGVPFHESRAAFLAAIQSFFEQPDDVVFGNESAQAVAERFAAGVLAVLGNSAEKTIAIVTHGVAPSHFLAPILEKSPFDTWLQIQDLGMPCYFVLTLPDLKLVTAASVV
ncbi:MAG: histidine phosphatase family protein [Candidatus Promineifilaceae bacterium]